MKNTLMTIVIAIAASWGFMSLSSTNQQDASSESVYDRVMRTGKIECAYFVESPFTFKDEATEEFSGIAIDLMKAIGKGLNLDIVWKEQMNFATFGESLNNDKYDAACGGIFVLPRAGVMDHTSAFAYVTVHGYVRPDDTRFDQKFDQVDWENMTVSGIDGEGATTAAQKVLPQAKKRILPQLSDVSEMLLAVSTGKADIAFVMPGVFEQFNKENPGKLKPAKLDRPLYTYDVGYAIARGQPEFKALLNNAIRQLTVSGELEALHKKYDPKGFVKAPVVASE